METARNVTLHDLEQMKTSFEVHLSEQLMSLEQRLKEHIERLQRETRCHCEHSVTRPESGTGAVAQPPPEPRETRPPAEPPATDKRTSTASDLVVIGDSITRSLSKHGLSKLTKKTATVSSTGGAVPTTLPTPTGTATATDVVIHAGTNYVNGTGGESTPESIANNIMKKAATIKTTSEIETVNLYVSSILQRNDLVDDSDSPSAANEKIVQTNLVLKDKCATGPIEVKTIIQVFDYNV